MAAIGGSVISVTVNGTRYAVTADSDYSIKLGGSENEVQANGDGSARPIKTRVPWSMTGGSVEIDHDRRDAQNLQAIANAASLVPITIELADGSIYQGTGTITGEAGFSTQSASRALDFSGPGILERQ